MKLLEARRITGELQGIDMEENKFLLYQLFVNDMGIFLQNSHIDFEKAREVVRIL